jgi:preprotein translocase subunit SecG
MNILINLLIVVEIIVSLLLILVILVQPSKSGGLGGALGGGMGEQLFGARTGNVMTKATIVLASVFLANTLLLTVLYSAGSDLTPASTKPTTGLTDGGAVEQPVVEDAAAEESTLPGEADPLQGETLPETAPAVDTPDVDSEPEVIPESGPEPIAN